jgi:hypothetical protein
LGQLSLSCSSSVGWRRRQASLNSPALRSLSSRRCLSSFLSCSLSRRSVTLLLTSPSTKGRIPPSGQLGALRRALSASRGDSSKIHRGRSRWLLVRRPASSFPQGPFPGTPAPEYMGGFPSRSSRKPADGLSERVASLVYAGASRVSEGSWTVAEDRCSVPPAGVTSATVEELVKTARAL